LMSSPWDAVIVGAGPAGSMTAMEIMKSRPDAKVLMLERREKVGWPMQCAGGITDFWLNWADLRPPNKATTAILKGARIYAPDGTFVEATTLGSDGKGLSGRVLDRVEFDGWMARKAVKEGAVLKRKHTVIGAVPGGLRLTAPRDARVRGLKDLKRVGSKGNFVEGTFPLPASVVLADGWASKTAPHMGIDTAIPAEDMYMGLQYTVPLPASSSSADGKKGRRKGSGKKGGAGKGNAPGRHKAGGVSGGGAIMPDLDRDFAVFIFGRAVAPMGYAWAFPTGGAAENLWRIGLGVHKGNPDLKSHLESLLTRSFPDAGKPVEVIGGGIPSSKPPSTNGHRVGSTEVYLVGDAARVCDPLTGGGLANAFVTGRCAAGAIASGKGIKAYDKAWKAEVHRDLKTKYKVKRLFMKWNDDEITRAVKALADYEPKGANPRREFGRLFRHLLAREPRLVASALRSML
jgi:digeranylgeranylglycerophospholipid reductase